MRIFKILGLLVVVVLTVLFVLHVLGWKRQKPPAPQEDVTLVGDDLTATPTLKVGEVLKWVSTGKNAFIGSVFCNGGSSPASLTPISLLSPDASGIQVASCTVTNVSSTVTFYYAILQGTRKPLNMDGLHPCPGCFFGGDPGSDMFPYHPTPGIPGPGHQTFADSNVLM